MSKVAAKALFRNKPKGLITLRLTERQRQILLIAGNGHLPLGTYCAIGYFRDGGVAGYLIRRYTLYPWLAEEMRKARLLDPTREYEDEELYPESEVIDADAPDYCESAILSPPKTSCSMLIPVHAINALIGPRAYHGDVARRMRQILRILDYDPHELANVCAWRERALRNVMLNS